jgi:hypothetical protein
MDTVLLSRPAYVRRADAQFNAFRQKVLTDGGTLETPFETKRLLRKLAQEDVLDDVTIGLVAGAYKAGKWYSFKGSDMDVVRATSGTRVNRSGVLTTEGNNIVRADYDGGVLKGNNVEPSATNQIRNNTMQGAVVGVIGSGGVLPTNWNVGGSGGLAQEVVAIGSENGVDYIDVKFSGTSGGTATDFRFEASNTIVATPSQTWTSSFYAKVINETLPPVSYNNHVFSLTSGGGFISESTLVINPTGVLSRFPFTSALNSGGTTARTNSMVRFVLVNGVAYDFTIRIGLPQMEQSAVATSVIKTEGSTATRNADNISKTGISSEIGQTEGAVLVEVDLRELSNRTLINLSIDDANGTTRTQNRVALDFTGFPTFRYRVIDSNVEQCNITGSVVAGVNKILAIYKTNEFRAYINGAQIGSTDTSGTIPSLGRAYIGQNIVSTADTFFNDHIRSATLFDKAIPEATAIRLTT